MKKLTMTRLLELTSLIMCMWVLALPVLAQEFRFVSFDFPGCDLSGPNGVNARGQVVGRCVDAKGVHGFLYDLNTGRSRRIDYPGATFTASADINARGEVVGRWIDSSGLSHGYRQDVKGNFHVVDPPASSACIVGPERRKKQQETGKPPLSAFELLDCLTSFQDRARRSQFQ